jgi:ammonia channel protein AmtB
MALVWIMIPGVGFFYSGLLRRKNALSMIFLSMVTVAVVSFQVGGCLLLYFFDGGSAGVWGGEYCGPETGWIEASWSKPLCLARHGAIPTPSSILLIQN